MNPWYPLGCLLILLVTACTHYTPVQAPPDMNRSFSQEGNATRPPQWWRAFSDAQLDALMQSVLQDNLSLKATRETVLQAELAARKAAADLYPSLDLGLSAGREDVLGGSGTSSRSYLASLQAAYSVDLWGKLNALHDAYRFDYEATRESYKQAALELAKEVANAWFELAEAIETTRLLRSQAEASEKLLAVLESRYRAGKAAASDILQQERLLEGLKAEVIVAQAQIAVLRQKLSALAARSPIDPMQSVPQLASLPPLPQTGMPSSLLKERPDVRAAYYTLEAADRRTASAIADRYPNITLDLALQSGAASASKIFENWVLAGAAALVQPLFDAGLREAEVARTKSAAREAAHLYMQTLLDAVREVETALVYERNQRAYRDSQAAQANLAKAAFESMINRYSRGSVTYFEALSTFSTWQELERSRISAQRQLLAYRIDLYAALGTSWEPLKNQTLSTGDDR